MISQEIYMMLNAQINAELWSSYLYLSMSLCAESQNYRGVSNWFYVQSREEFDHSRVLEKYVMAQNRRVILMPIAEVRTEWPTPLEMFRQSLAHEQKVTKMISEIMNRAQADRDYATCSMLSWFVDEQLEEEETFDCLVLKFEKANESLCYSLQIDSDLQKRKYEPNIPKNHGRWFD